MTPAGLAELQADEGYRPLASYRSFRDTRGNWTIAGGICGAGIGPNTVWTPAQAAAAWAQRVAATESGLRGKFVGFAELETSDPVRADAIVNLAFNLGVDGLCKNWPITTAHLEAHAWQAAASDLLDNSKWVSQVHEGRAERIAHALLTESWDGVRPSNAPPYPDIAWSQAATAEALG